MATLFNCDEVQEYIREHEVNVHNPKKKKKSPAKLSIKEKILFNGLKHVSWMRK